jgi:3-isopropylmalate/(R)-2-methylmalate dehydratase small subunit
MDPFTILTGVAAPMPMPDINTDAITPMAAGRSTSADIGKLLFANWRYTLDGAEIPDFILNKPPFREAKIIVAGANFGCGSSRERAVWALMKFGIRCVIAPSFADIFRENSYQNGLLPVVLPPAQCEALAGDMARAADPRLIVDLRRSEVQTLDGRVFAFSVPAERREALLEGLAEIDVILRMTPDIDAFQQRDAETRPWIYATGVHSEK